LLQFVRQVAVAGLLVSKVGEGVEVLKLMRLNLL
jgi:hypothetical protein